MNILHKYIDDLKTHFTRLLTKGATDIIERFINDLQEYADSTANEFDNWAVDAVRDLFNIERRKHDTGEDTEGEGATEGS